MKPKKIIKLLLTLSVAMALSACGGGKSPLNGETDSQEEVEPTQIDVQIIGPSEIKADELSTYRGLTSADEPEYEWQVDGKVVSTDEELEEVFSEGKHVLKLNVKSISGASMSSEKIVSAVPVKEDVSEESLEDNNTVLKFNGGVFDITDIVSAQYFSINEEGKRLDFEILSSEKFSDEAGLTVELNQKTSGAFYSHLTIFFSETTQAYILKDGMFVELNNTMILRTELETDEMSGLNSAKFSVKSSERIDPSRVNSFSAILDIESEQEGKMTGFVSQGADYIDDPTVFTWEEDGFQTSLPLSYGNQKIISSAVCIDEHADNGNLFYCSNILQWESRVRVSFYSHLGAGSSLL